MLLMVQNGIRGGICNSIYRYAKADNKYMQDYDENKEPPYLNYWDIHNLYDWAISQRLPTFNFEWVKDTSTVNEEIIKKVSMGIFLKLMFNTQKITWTS